MKLPRELLERMDEVVKGEGSTSRHELIRELIREKSERMRGKDCRKLFER
jgi:metal-responsive CopG/Arc/MetJ family transcriptional regulator